MTKTTISQIAITNRNAFDVLEAVNGFSGNVYIEKQSEQRRADAKSLLGLLSLGVCKHDPIAIYIDEYACGCECTLTKLISVLENRN